MMTSSDIKNPRIYNLTSLSNLSMPQIYNNNSKKFSKRSKSIVMDIVKDGNAYYQDVVVNNSILVNQTQYMTSEKFHGLNKDSSYISVGHSNSTIFYDLDQIAKRHSYHCITEMKDSNLKACKNVKKQENRNGFRAKSEAIVQECATNIQPTLKTRGSFEIITGKLRKRSNNGSNLSSEIFLKDNDNIYIEKDHYNKELKHHQNIWSYAKYRTEYTNPISSSKKCRKKDTDKRTEDPCPCQLFSYACPCTNKKSLTELARNSKSITVLDQVTSTSKVKNNDTKTNKSKKINEYFNIGGKKKSAHNIERIQKIEMSTSDDPVINILNKPDISKTNYNNLIFKNIKPPSKPHKKRKQIICPNCKEKVDVISTADEEESIKSKNSPVFNNSDTIYTEENPNSWPNNHENNLTDDDDVCIHNPPCELVPVCQILPIDQELINPKSTKPQQADVRNNPRNIRITKACRHHPPCTVVPSCQRINVLKNNCEFIPPCPHRPRCMNLPLCVPISKTIDYKVIQNHIHDINNTERMQATPCKYFSMCQHDSLNNNAEPEFHAVQNTCEYLSEYTPRFIVNPKIPCMSSTFSPCQVQQNLSCRCCKSDKSCQYVVNSKITALQKPKKSTSSAVIYIRDVGCQFRNKNTTPGDSLIRSKASSTSFDFADKKTGNYFTNVHTLRCEDKFTNPISGEELSMSTISTSSLDIDIHCPSHGKQAFSRQKQLSTGFDPKSTNSPIIGVLTTVTKTPVEFFQCQKQRKINSTDTRKINSYTTKVRRSCLRIKYKNVYSTTRRRKARSSSHVFSTIRNISYK